MLNFQFLNDLFAEIMILKSENKQGDKAGQGHVNKNFSFEIGGQRHGYFRSAALAEMFFYSFNPRMHGQKKKWALLLQEDLIHIKPVKQSLKYLSEFYQRSS